MSKITLEQLKGLEREVRRFLDCGWILQYSRKDSSYMLLGPSKTKMYSSGDLEEEVFSTLDYEFQEEAASAKRILKFIVDHEELVHNDFNPYKKYIRYTD